MCQQTGVNANQTVVLFVASIFQTSLRMCELMPQTNYLHMIEWMYSEPPEADPANIVTRSGHIWQAGQGPLEAGQCKSTRNKRRSINFLALYFLPKLQFLNERKAINNFVETKI